MKKILTAAFLLTTAIACTKNEYEPGQPDAVPAGCDIGHITYAGDVAPMVTSNCAFDGCHGTNRGYGVNFEFTDYEGLKEAAGSILDRINRKGDDPLHMPSGFNLDSCSLYMLNAWIINGAPNN